MTLPYVLPEGVPLRLDPQYGAQTVEIGTLRAEIATLAAALPGLYARNPFTLAFAESLTGGLISAAVVEVAGSSQYFDRGFVTYSNAAKVEELGVPAEIIARFGAVSAPTAYGMAAGALNHSGADFTAAVTGIAGPTGGSAEKPVGTVYFGFGNCRDGLVHLRHCIFHGDREAVRLQTVREALSAITCLLNGRDIPGATSVPYRP